MEQVPCEEFPTSNCKVKWQSQKNVLSFDFVNRAMVPAHSNNVAKAIKQDKKLQKQEKEQLATFYSKSGDHVNMPIELKQNGNQLILGKDFAIILSLIQNKLDFNRTLFL